MNNAALKLPFADETSITRIAFIQLILDKQFAAKWYSMLFFGWTLLYFLSIGISKFKKIYIGLVLMWPANGPGER